MFKISFFVRDNRLADLLKSVDGKCLNLEVQPVRLPDEAEAQKYAFFPNEGKTAKAAQPAKSERKKYPLRTDLIPQAPKVTRGRGTKPAVRVADAVWHLLPEEFDVSSAKQSAVEAGLSISAVTNRVNKGIKNGTLRRVSTGRYRKVAA